MYKRPGLADITPTVHKPTTLTHVMLTTLRHMVSRRQSPSSTPSSPSFTQYLVNNHTVVVNLSTVYAACLGASEQPTS